jgi:hypothetical protein
MKMNNLVGTLAIAWVVLMTGCQPDEVVPSNASNPLKKTENSNARIFSGTVPLGSVSTFAVLAATTITNDGESVITGNLGVSPGSAITGFQPIPLNTISGPGTVTSGLGIVNGTIYAGGPIAAQAHNDAVIAYNYLVAQEPDTTFAGVTQLDGMTFTPGVYSFAPSANLLVNGTVYLDFQGNSDAVFIFQTTSTLVTMTGSNVIALNNNDSTCAGANVYWAVGSSATIDGNQFIGTVIAHTTITMTSASNVSGGIIAVNGAVTMINNKISACGGSDGGTPPNPKPCSDFVTGGGRIGNHATFGVSGGIKNNRFRGQLSYNDHAKNIKVKSTSVTAYIVIDSVTRQIEGRAKVNGRGSFKYTVIVVDNGEPGRNDSFSLELSNGYNKSGTLKGGNIQLHKSCSDGDDHDNDDDDCDKDHGHHDSHGHNNH